MQKINGLTIFNDIFVAKSVLRADLANAISHSFQIRQSNIFFEGEGKENWDETRVSAFVYGYDGGDIDWKLDIISDDLVEIATRLKNLAKIVGVPVFYDRRSQQSDSRVDLFDPECRQDAAELVVQEDDEGDVRLFVKRTGQAA